ncbi:MAG: hypothetical protein ABSG69_18070, partial [Candidatus Acidiferrum sp.]|jgi:hypothetical protein
MARDFVKSLRNVIGRGVHVKKGSAYPQEGTASAVLSFVDGSELQADYSRVEKNGKAELSGFDHRQKYGLPRPSMQ